MTKKKRDLIKLEAYYCFACGTITPFHELNSYAEYEYPGAEPYCHHCLGEIESAADKKIKEIKIKSGMWKNAEKES